MTRSRALAIALGLLGGVLAFVAVNRTWVTERVAGLPDAAATHVAGDSLAASVPALALVALASAVVLGTAGRTGRYVAAVLLVVAGAGIPLAVVRATTGISPDVAGPVSGWAWVTAGAGLPLLLAGGLAAALAGRWPAPARRYERTAELPADQPAEPRAEADRSAPESDTWASLSRGEDPT